MGVMDFLLGELPPGLAFMLAVQATLTGWLCRLVSNSRAMDHDQRAAQHKELMSQLHQDRLAFMTRHEAAEGANQRRHEAAIAEHKSDHGGIREDVSRVKASIAAVKTDIAFITGKLNGGSGGGK